MTCNLWIRKALSSCLMVAVMATYSMVTLAGPGKVAGDLTVLGKGINNEAPFVLVNGETARTGRSVFPSSTVTTPEGVSAVISLNNIGRIEIAANSTFTINVEGDRLSGDLAEGKITVLNSSLPAYIKTPAGIVSLNAGETAVASGKAQDDDDDDKGGAAWWLFAIGMGGALAGILYAVARDTNSADLGGGGTVISPIR